MKSKGTHCVKFSGLKKCQCTKYDKYEVWWDVDDDQDDQDMTAMIIEKKKNMKKKIVRNKS